MFVPTRLAKRMFFQLNSKQKVCSSRRIYIAPFLSQSNKTLPNTCFASEPYSLSMVRLETFQSCWFHECIYTPAETTKLCFSQPRSVPRGRIYTLSPKGNIMRLVYTDGSAKCKRFHYYLRNFHLKGDFQTKTQRTIDNNKSTFLSAILLLPEFHCSRKLISFVSRSRPLSASRPTSHVSKTQCP